MKLNPSPRSAIHSGMSKISPRHKSKLCLELLFASNILILLVISPNNALLNCGQPSMFKANKGGQYAGNGNGYAAPQYVPQQMAPMPGLKEHNYWYQPNPQASPYPQQNPYGFVKYPTFMSPMKMLFQPKWKSASLFSPMRSIWGMGWKTGANSNFYRPYMGHSMPPVNQFRPSPGAELPGFFESSGGLVNQGQSAFIQQQQQRLPSYSYPASIIDGWSQPVASYNQNQNIEQSPLNGLAYDASYTQAPVRQQASYTPTSDSYSSGVKGGIASSFRPATVANATAIGSSFLLANGNLDSYNSILSDALRGPVNQSSFGYSYPEMYSGAVESPSQIAQQLLKFGIKKQQAQRSAAQTQGTGLSSSQKSSNKLSRLASSSRLQFTILDEPRFVGFGTADSLSGKEARLSCSFGEAIDQTNRPLWIKFVGPYNSSHVAADKTVPPFNCVDTQCRTQEVESTKDYRYKFDNGPATSTLIITEPRLADYGTYRCSALTKAVNNDPIETVYQVVHFRNI